MLRIKRLTNLKNLQRCQRTRWSMQFKSERSSKIQRELQRRTQARCIRRCIASEMRRLSRQNRIRSSCPVRVNSASRQCNRVVATVSFGET